MANRLRWAGPGLLCLAGLLLVLAWDRIPERWITHWGAHGRADGFAHKRPLEVFLPLLIGAMVWLLLESIATLIARTGRKPELARATALPLRLQAIGLAATFALIGVALPLLQPERPQVLVVPVLLLTFGPLLGGFVYLARVVARLRREGHTELEGWHGFVYSNRNDARLFVPHTMGMGYTLNFGRPAAWGVLAVLLFPAAMLVILLMLR